MKMFFPDSENIFMDSFYAAMEKNIEDIQKHHPREHLHHHNSCKNTRNVRASSECSGLGHAPLDRPRAHLTARMAS